MIRLLIPGVLIVILTFAGCAEETIPEDIPTEMRFSHILSLELFDTLTNVIGYAHSQEEFEYFAGIIYGELRHLHQLFDKFNEYQGFNNIRTINNNAGIQPVEVHPDILALLTTGIEAYHKTNGLVNIALGPVTSIWHEYILAGEAVLPCMDALIAASRLTNINDIIIEEANNTVFLRYAGMSLDVGSIGKGFAMESAAQKAIDAGFLAFALHVGGDVRLVGAPRSGDRDAWGIGILDPENPREIVDVIFAADTAVFTSGDYLRFYMVNGARYHHIIDPRTLMPAVAASSATVIYPCGTTAEILSLAAFILGADEGKETDLDTIWILPDGTVARNVGTFN